MKTYQAPWGGSLVVMSAILTLVCAVIPFATSFWVSGAAGAPALLLGWLPLVVLAGCLPFVIRGYEITEDAILIRRLGWTTRLERADLRSAQFVPKAMRRSLRTCGNGGGFSFTGWYWSRSLGHYRAWVTDLNRTVVLRFHQRTVVVSPDSPEDFVAVLNG